jgi:hypothetical protein
VDSAGAASLEAVVVLSAGAVEVAALEVEPPQATSMLAAMLAARIAETCFFIGCSPFLPFGLCGASSFCVPRDVSILENFFHFVQR